MNLATKTLRRMAAARSAVKGRLALASPLLALVLLLTACSSSTPPPAAPENVRVQVGAAELIVSWSAAAGASSYNLYLAAEPGVTKENYQSKEGGLRRSGVSSPHTESGLTGGVTYYLVVTAVNAAGESAASAEVSATPVGGTFEPTEDVSLAEGSYDFDTVTIPAGVTVTVTGEVLFNVSGDTTIGGTLAGDCTGMELRGAGALTVGGLIRNTCTDAAQAPADLKLVIGGEVTIGLSVSDEPALSSDGVLTLSDTATEDVPLEPIGEVLRAAPRAVPGPAQGGGGIVINRPVRGKRGVSVHSDNDVAANATVSAADGQAAPLLQAAPNCDNRGALGGAGGSVYLASRNGVLMVNGALQAGSGGAGGACEADASGDGTAATAMGGRGGRGGGVYVGGQQVVFGAGARLVRGSGGPGGEATAIGSDGLAACEDGFAATATGGRGGEAGGIGYVILEPGNIVGNPVEDGGDGGAGGVATAFGGFGQDCDDGDGGQGGDAAATGGQGGDGAAGNIWPTAANSHRKGDGGAAQAQGGRGGNGSDACAPAAQGGDGGAGGDATTTGGQAGTKGLGGGGQRGSSFGLGFGAGSGGAGGDGNPFGLGGAPGAATGDPDPVDEGTPGADGELCPVQGALHFLDLDGLPQGALEPGAYALAVLAEDRETPTGESVATVVRSDGAAYVKEGELLFVGADGGLEFDLKALSGRAPSFRATVNPEACGEVAAGAVQLRGLVGNEVVATRVAETGGGETVVQLDYAAGLEDVYLESVGAPLCLGAFGIALGLDSGGAPSEAASAFVDFGSIPAGDIADDSAYCLALVDTDTGKASPNYAVQAIFDWDFSQAGMTRAVPEELLPESRRVDGRIDFIGQILLSLYAGGCLEPLGSVFGAEATVTSAGAPGSTSLRGYREGSQVAADSSSAQNAPERLSLSAAEALDELRLTTSDFGSFDAGEGVVIRYR